MKHLPILLMIAIFASFAFAQEKSEWIELFDGKTMNGWTSQKGGEPKGWDVQDGAIHRSFKGGNIHSTREFYDFELVFEWKVAKGTNSGLKYRFHDGVGPEYQIHDDEAGNESLPHRQAASLYYIAAAEGKELKPVGEWNTSKIVAKGNHIEHWLNDRKVVELEIDSDDWNKRKATSKFKDRENFAKKPGPIHIQEHGGEVWFRGLKIREL